ncbi:MAG: DUF1737 domain-containing protein [Pyrinomonadaceae bacterium]|nr:DUF1737 domain-containing protein [Pyrinomonadaceae bacterium]
MEYELVTSNYDFQLSEYINKRLSEGWELYGELKVVGVFPYESGVSGIEPIFHYAQAIIRHSSKSKSVTKASRKKR